MQKKGADSVSCRVKDKAVIDHGRADERTLIGASSSSNMGCEMKISRAFVHK